MSLVCLGNSNLSNMILGDAQIVGVWLGNVLVWPTSFYDTDNKLLDEREHGFRGVSPGESHEEIIVLDRAVNKDNTHQGLRDIAAENGLGLMYEEKNHYPYIFGIARDKDDVHEDREYIGMKLDGNINDDIIREYLPDLPDDDPVVIVSDTNPS